MPRQRKRTGEMGGIEQQCGRYYRAHIMYYDDAGVHKNMRGPFRAERRQAEEDLSAMRAAGVAAEGELAAAAEAVRQQAVMLQVAQGRGGIEKSRAAGSLGRKISTVWTSWSKKLVRMSILASAAELATNCRKFVGKSEAVIPIRLA